MHELGQLIAEEFDHVVGVTIHARGTGGKTRQIDASMVFTNDRENLRAKMIEFASAPGNMPGSDLVEHDLREHIRKVFRMYVVEVVGSEQATPRMQVSERQVELVYDDAERNTSERPLMLHQGDSFFIYRDKGTILQPTINWASRDEISPCEDVQEHEKSTLALNREIAMKAMRDRGGWNGAGEVYGGVTRIPGVREHCIVWAVVQQGGPIPFVFYAAPVQLDWLGVRVARRPK